MQTKKRIILIRGKIDELAAACGVSRMTVTRALSWKNDTDTMRKVRAKAKELGLIKQEYAVVG